MDNLIAAGKTKPMIIVNENGTPPPTPGAGARRGNAGAPRQAAPGGNAGASAAAGGPTAAGASGGRGAGGRGTGARNFMDNPYTEFGNVVTQDLIPFIDATSGLSPTATTVPMPA